jgi:hypothetical protein
MPTKTEDWLVATESFVGELADGTEFIARADKTLIRSDSPAAKRWPELFRSSDPPARTETSGWLVANQAFVGQLPDGTDFIGKANVTRVRTDSVAAKLWPNLFKPIDASYEVEAAVARPGERRS